MDSTVAVKLNFYGDLRRFSFVPTTFQVLVAQVASLLNVDPSKELVLKYLDEEGDLITLTSDLELKSAVTSKVLRLFATFKSDATPAVLHASSVPSVPVAASQPAQQPSAPVAMDVEPVHLYPQVPSQGGWREPGGWHRGPRPFGGPRGRHHGHGEGFGRHHGGFNNPEGMKDFCSKKDYHKGGRRGFKAWWNNEDKEALMQKNQELVEEIVKMGFGLPREKILKMILKTQWKCDMYGKKLGPNDTVIVSHVASKLAFKKERKEAKAAARAEKKKEQMEEK